MARNSGGTYSLPSGNPVITGTTISSSTHNTTMSDIATELTNSLDRSGRGAMTGPLQLPNGSVTAPALTFSSDTDAGLYRAGADDIRMAADGSEIQRWTASGSTATSVFTTAKGLTANQATANTAAITATGNGSAAGVVTTGGATGAGLSATGGGSAVGATLANGTSATAAAPQNALALTNGNLQFSGASPNANVGFSNVLTPKNTLKAYAKITTDGAGGITLQAGFNVSSVAIAVGEAVITLVTGIANTTASAPIVSGNDATGTANYAVRIISATQVAVNGYDIIAAAGTNFTTSARSFTVLIFGEQ